MQRSPHQSARNVYANSPSYQQSYSSSPYESGASYESSNTGGGEENMAGFGARRFAESSRRKVEEAETRRREWQEAKAREQWESERREREEAEAMIEQQRRYEEHQRQRYEAEIQKRHEEEQRSLQRRRIEQQRHVEEQEQQRSQQQYQNQQSRALGHMKNNSEHDAYGGTEDETAWYRIESGGQDPRSRHHRDPPGSSHRDSSSSRTATPLANATQLPEFQASHKSQRQHALQSTHSPGFSIDSSACGGLPYDNSNSSLHKYSQEKSVSKQPVIPESSQESGYLSLVDGHSRDTAHLSLAARKQQRATIYEDEYEEGENDDEDLSINFARYTQYNGLQEEDLGGSAWSGARKSLFQSTTDQPLPKAKCADCGEALDFDQLAGHACEAASVPGTPTVPLTPLSSSMSRETSKSPFFDRSDRWQGDKGLTSSSPSAGLMSRSGSAEKGSPLATGQSQPLIGLGFRSATSPTTPSGGLTSPSAATAPFLLPSSASYGSAGSSPTDETAAARRKQIEAQREAKKRGETTLQVFEYPARTASQSSTRLASNSPSLRLSPSVAASGRPSVRQPGQTHPTHNVSSSSASSLSSTMTDASSLLNSASSPVSVAITPSSSFDRFSDKNASPPRDNNLLSPPLPTLPWTAQSKSGEETGPQRSPSSAAVAEARRMRLAQLAAAAPSSKSTGFGAKATQKSKTRRSPPKELDLGNIEDLMQDLHLQADSTQAVSQSRRSPASASAPLPRERVRTPGTGNSLPEMDRPVRRHKTPRPIMLCCVCLCSLSSSKTPCVEQDGKLFCAEDYRQLFLPKCSKCRQPVEKNAVRSSDGALKGIFHRSCFCCFQCDARFADGVFYVMDNAPYCFEHYSALAGTQCASCGLGIEGQCRQTDATGERYHPHCLTCQYEDHRTGEFCRDLVEDFYIIDNRRLCEHHANSVQARLDAARGKHGAKTRRAEKRRTMLRTLR